MIKQQKHSRPRKAYGAFAAFMIIASGLANDTQALSFSVTKGSALQSDPAASVAFDRAVGFYQGLFSDQITVSIEADLKDLGNSVLAQSTAELQQGLYRTVRNQLVSDQVTYHPGDITDRLPATSQFNAQTSVGTSVGSTLALTNANAKALGLALVSNGPDGRVEFTTGVGLDFDRSDGIDSDSFDFEALAIHEIGHILGFVSALDLPSSSTLIPTTLDLFRLAPNAGDTSFTSAPRILEPRVNAVTYLGAGQEAPMETGVNDNGDGQQASHWQDGDIGIMDPTLRVGEKGVFTDNDLRALDLIGWDVSPIGANASAVPVPAAIWLFGSGILLLLRIGTGRR